MVFYSIWARKPGIGFLMMVTVFDWFIFMAIAQIRQCPSGEVQEQVWSWMSASHLNVNFVAGARVPNQRYTFRMPELVLVIFWCIFCLYTYFLYNINWKKNPCLNRNVVWKPSHVNARLINKTSSPTCKFFHNNCLKIMDTGCSPDGLGVHLIKFASLVFWWLPKVYTVLEAKDTGV